MKPQDLSNGESATNPYEAALRGISSPERCALLAGVALQLQIHRESLSNTLWAIQVGAELAARFNDDLFANSEEDCPNYATSRTLGAVLALIDSSARYVSAQLEEIAGGDA